MSLYLNAAANSPAGDFDARGDGAYTDLMDALFAAVRSFTAPSLVLRLDATDDRACVVRGHPEAWKHALRVLIRNAAVVTPDGAQVHIGFHADAAGVRITVSDAGVGIPPSELAMVAEGPTLDALRDAVDAAGGMFVVESGEPRPGTRIEIVIPPALDPVPLRSCRRPDRDLA